MNIVNMNYAKVKASYETFTLFIITSAYTKSSNSLGFNPILQKFLRDDLWDNFLQNSLLNFLDFLSFVFY